MENQIRDVLQQMKTILFPRKITIIKVLAKTRKSIVKVTAVAKIKKKQQQHQKLQQQQQ